MWDARIKFEGRLFDGPITPAISRGISRTVPKALSILQSNTPVDTGAMRASWLLGVKGNKLKIENRQYYSGFVEIGNRYYTGRYPLKKSLPAIEDEFKKNIADEVSKQLGERLSTDFKSTLKNVRKARRSTKITTLSNRLPTKF